MEDDSNIADDDDDDELLLLQSLHSCTSDDDDANADEVVSARRAKVMQADLLDAVERLIVRMIDLYFDNIDMIMIIILWVIDEFNASIQRIKFCE